MIQDVSASDIQDLVGFLGDDSASVRYQAGQFLVGFGSESLPPLIDRLKAGKDVKVVLGVLRAIGDADAAGAVAGLLDSPDEEIANMAGGTLSAFGDGAVPVVADLAHKQGMTDTAAGILKNVREPSDESIELVRGLLSDDDPKVRAAAVSVLEAWKDGYLIENIGNLITDEDAGVREAVARAYGYLADEYDRELVFSMMKDQAPGVRIAAAGMLERSPDKSNVGPLLKLVESDPDGMVRAVALASLVATGDQAAKAALMKGLDDEDANVVITSLWFLDDLKVEGAADKIVAMFKSDRPVIHKDKLVLQEALITLTNLAERVDISAFMKYLNTGEEYATRKLLLEMASAIGNPGDKDVISAVERYQNNETNEALKELAGKTLEKLK